MSRIEAVNRNTLCSLALTQGYLPFRPDVDEGIDLILYREADEIRASELRVVQLKGRMVIDRKYVERDIWIAFHDGGDPAQWYLIPHDTIVEMEKDAQETRSWTDGTYSWPYMSKGRRERYEAYRFPAPDVDPDDRPADAA